MPSNSDEKLVEQYMPKDIGLFGKFLGAKQHKQRTLDKIYDGYKTPLLCKAISEVMKTYNVRSTFNIGYSGIISPTYKNLQVSRDLNEELLFNGYHLLLDSKTPLVFSIHQTWTGDMSVSIIYKAEDSNNAMVLVKAIDTYMVDNNFYKGEKINGAGEFLPIPNIGFDEIILPENQKKTIKMGALDFFNKKEIYLKSNIDFKRGIILTGTPGTGKTLTGKILMGKSDSTFIWITSEMVEKGRDIKRIFKMAKELAPVVLFMEDMDDALEQNNVIDVLKTTMDGLDGLNDGICTIMCTNHPDKLPMSLLRPGRFDDLIILQLPTEENRLNIAIKVSKFMDIENKEELLADLAKNTEGFTPAQIKEVLVYSLLLAVDNNRELIKEEDIANALLKLNNTKQTISEDLVNMDVKSFLADLKKGQE